jgi:hypothetical protein
MQSYYAQSFNREMGCTPEEWHGWLPQAMGHCEWTVHGHAEGAAEATFQSLFPDARDAALRIAWQATEPRKIALFSIPRLKVSFTFTGLDDAQRYKFMKRFDLYMQRGGG